MQRASSRSRACSKRGTWRCSQVRCKGVTGAATPALQPVASPIKRAAAYSFFVLCTWHNSTGCRHRARPQHAPSPHTRAVFLLYAFTAAATVVWLIYWVAPKHGTTNIFVYIGICSTAGSLSVISCKALGIAIKLTLQGSNQLTDPHTIVFIVVSCLCCCCPAAVCLYSACCLAAACRLGSRPESRLAEAVRHTPNRPLVPGSRQLPHHPNRLPQ